MGMKKVLIIISAILAAGAVTAGTIVTVGILNRQEAHQTQQSEQDPFRYAKECYAKKLEEKGVSGPESDASFYIGQNEKWFTKDALAWEELADEVLTLAKAYGNIPPERTIADLHDRGLYYDFLLECSNLCMDQDLPMTDEERASILLLLSEVYYGLADEENDPYIDDFDAVKDRRDAALTALEKTGAPYFGPAQGR